LTCAPRDPGAQLGVAEAVALGYCCGFLVEGGFAWVGGIAGVGQVRVEIEGSWSAGLHWRGEDRQQRERYQDLQDRTPLPAWERVPVYGADRHAAKRGGESGESGTCFWEFVDRLDGGLSRISKYRSPYQESTVEGFEAALWA
jgi:hypothetical protein